MPSCHFTIATATRVCQVGASGGFFAIPAGGPLAADFCVGILLHINLFAATRIPGSSHVQAFSALAMVDVLKRMPFTSKGAKKTKPNRLSQLDKQRQWVTQGLKHLKAPAATRLCFRKLSRSPSLAIHPNPPIPNIVLDYTFIFRACIALGSKVLSVLASMVFATPGLDWSAIDHLETFAGKQSVTKGELEAGHTKLYHAFGDVWKYICIYVLGGWSQSGGLRAEHRPEHTGHHDVPWIRERDLSDLKDVAGKCITARTGLQHLGIYVSQLTGSDRCPRTNTGHQLSLMSHTSWATRVCTLNILEYPFDSFAFLSTAES